MTTDAAFTLWIHGIDLVAAIIGLIGAALILKVKRCRRPNPCGKPTPEPQGGEQQKLRR